MRTRSILGEFGPLVGDRDESGEMSQESLRQHLGKPGAGADSAQRDLAPSHHLEGAYLLTVSALEAGRFSEIARCARGECHSIKAKPAAKLGYRERFRYNKKVETGLADRQTQTPQRTK